MYLAQNYDLLNLAKTLEIKKDLEVKRNPLFLMPKPAPISDPLTPSRRHTPKPHPLQPYPKALSPFSVRHFVLPQKQSGPEGSQYTFPFCLPSSCVFIQLSGSPKTGTMGLD